MTPQRRANLKRLLAPQHVAFIGGSSAASAAEQCAGSGFDGTIWGVNPRRETLGGAPCFTRVEDLPEPPDAVFLAVPRDAVVESVSALRRFGAGGVVCYTAGFRERGDEGAALEHELLEAAGELGLIGPNCLGVLNYARGVMLWPYAHGGENVERGVALLSQSGLLGTNLTMNERSLRFAYVFSVGNQTVVGIEDLVDALADDPAVSAIALYVEGLRDVATFSQAAARALERGIPIVALKAGASEIASRLTITHTGSLSGTDELYQALFDRLGIIRVDSPAALLETLKMLTIAVAPRGRRIAAFTCSGGDSTLLGDWGARTGISFPQPSPLVVDEVTALLPPIATVCNPLDYTTPLWGNEKTLTQIFGGIFKDNYDAALLVQDYMRAQFREDNDSYRADARAFIAATRTAGIPAAICSGLAENMDRDAREMMIAGGVAPLQGINEALNAIAHAATYGEHRAKIVPAGDVSDLHLPPVPSITGDVQTLDEWQGKQLLAVAGVPLPHGHLVEGPAAADVAADIGFPVAVKMVSAALPHKTETGAIQLGLTSASQVNAAVETITDSVGRHAPNAVSDLFLVEQMITHSIAELIVGIRHDEQFGQIMVIGGGGTLAELYHDSRSLLLPTDRETVSRTLASLKVSTLIDGYRGQLAGDRDAVVDVILTLAQFAEQHRNGLAELDVNPLLVLPKGVCAADVLLRMAAI